MTNDKAPVSQSAEGHIMTDSNQSSGEREAIVAWLRRPMALHWTIKPWSKRIWFAWHILRGNFQVFDGVRMHASEQIKRGG